MLVEPAGLSVLREYEIPWKKQSYDIAELAHLRFEEGLGSRPIGPAVTGQLKTATLKMAKMAVEAQQHQISYGKFSRMLTAPSRHR